MLSPLSERVIAAAAVAANADSDANEIHHDTHNQRRFHSSSNSNSLSTTQPCHDLATMCYGCQQVFASRNAVFQHLKDTHGACLPVADYQDFCKYVFQKQKREKVVVLYGYYLERCKCRIPFEVVDTYRYQQKQQDQDVDDSDKSASKCTCFTEYIRNGAEVATILLNVLEQVSDPISLEDITHDRTQPYTTEPAHETLQNTTPLLVMDSMTREQQQPQQHPQQQQQQKANRSYGNVSRPISIVAQDDETGAICEVVATRLSPLGPIKIQQWIERINNALQERCCGRTNLHLRVFGRLPMPKAKFNAEMDVTHRRVEYLLPMDFLYVPSPTPARKENVNDNNNSDGRQPCVHYMSSIQSRLDYFATFPSFTEGFHTRNHASTPQQPQPSSADTCPLKTDGTLHEHATTVQSKSSWIDSSTSPLERVARSNPEQQQQGQTWKPGHETLQYLHSLKKIMQSLTTQVVKLDTTDRVAMQEKEQNNSRRYRSRHAGQLAATATAAAAVAAAATAESTGITTIMNEITLKSRKQRHRVKAQKQHNHSQGDSKDVIVVAKPEAENIGNTSSKTLEKKNRKDDTVSSSTNNNTIITTKNILRRRRFHNFTPTVMAHDFLAYRRLDRFYHRATLRFDPILADVNDPNSLPLVNDDSTARPYLVLSITGDMFLTGQVSRVVGLFLALARGLIDPDFIDCVFDETYPHLVPTPPAPIRGMYAVEAYYMSWEGKAQTILTPRFCNRYSQGWNDAETIRMVHEWQTEIRSYVAHSWLLDGIDPTDQRLLCEKRWVNEVLEPWAVCARKQLVDYRKWKTMSRNGTAANKNGDKIITETGEGNDNEPLSLVLPFLPPLNSINPAVPPIYEQVLFYLRQADASGLWPTTTPKRKLVMVSTPTAALIDKRNGKYNPNTDGYAASLSLAITQAKVNKTDRTSAYGYVEGEGGASGSFSVGAMPGTYEQPKANALFPELMKAAFQLEMALCPSREPSSTIAINRNAQFRPHTDSGAGAGQSTSLIVGLGTYVGGELMVEGTKENIRYRAIEFNGWKQRHWTMPFQGERFSLVWFTPKGCEGIRGIDLCQA